MCEAVEGEARQNREFVNGISMVKVKEGNGEPQDGYLFFSEDIDEEPELNKFLVVFGEGSTIDFDYNISLEEGKQTIKVEYSFEETKKAEAPQKKRVQPKRGLAGKMSKPAPKKQAEVQTITIQFLVTFVYPEEFNTFKERLIILKERSERKEGEQ